VRQPTITFAFESTLTRVVKVHVYTTPAKVVGAVLDLPQVFSILGYRDTHTVAYTPSEELTLGPSKPLRRAGTIKREPANLGRSGIYIG
jgi:hypothetical protein